MHSFFSPPPPPTPGRGDLRNRPLEFVQIGWGDMVSAAKNAKPVPMYRLNGEAKSLEENNDPKIMVEGVAKPKTVDYVFAGKGSVVDQFTRQMGQAGVKDGMETPFAEGRVVRATYQGINKVKYPRGIILAENNHSAGFLASIPTRIKRLFNGLSTTDYIAPSKQGNSKVYVGSAANYSMRSKFETLGQWSDIFSQMQGLFNLFAEYGMTLDNADTFEMDSLPNVNLHGISRGSISAFNTLAFLNAAVLHSDQAKQQYATNSQAQQDLDKLKIYLTKIVTKIRQAHYETLTYSPKNALEETLKGFTPFRGLNVIMGLVYTLPLYLIYKPFSFLARGVTWLAGGGWKPGKGMLDDFSEFHYNRMFGFAQGIGMISKAFDPNGPTVETMMPFAPTHVHAMVVSSPGDWRVAHKSSMKAAHKLQSLYQQQGAVGIECQLQVLQDTGSYWQQPGHGGYSYGSAGKEYEDFYQAFQTKVTSDEERAVDSNQFQPDKDLISSNSSHFEYTVANRITGMMPAFQEDKRGKKNQNPSDYHRTPEIDP